MEKKFRLVINLVKALNALHDGVGTEPMFTYHFEDDAMVIIGIPARIAQLLALVWSESLHFSFYIHRIEYNTCIRVIRH